MKTLYPHDVALQFLTKYKQFEMGELSPDDPIYTPEQINAIYISIVANPMEMITFFNTVQTLVINTILMERGDDNHLEVNLALIQLFNSWIGTLFPMIAVSTKTPEEREQIREKYETFKQFNRIETNNKEHNSLDNIGFKLPSSDNPEE